jgi:hypothetical protein
MAHWTPQERAYAALHDDYTNGLLDRDAYLAAFVQLRPTQRPRRRPPPTWLIVAVVLAIGLTLIYVSQI